MREDGGHTGVERETYGEPVATASSNESVPWGIFQTRSENALAYSVKAPRPLAASRKHSCSGSADACITQALTTNESRADTISDLEIYFEIRSELYDFSRQVAPGVSAF